MLFMNVNKTLIGTLVIAMLGAGCSSGGPSTRRGALGGAAAGAVLGGIVGHQSGEGVAGAAIGAAAGGAAGAAIGNKTDRERGTLDSQTQPTIYDQRTTQIIHSPPPTPTSQPYESIPARPAPDAVWIQGYYAYTGNSANPYEWVPGHWEIPPPGSRTWIPPSWQRSGDGYIYQRGHWQ